MDEALPIAKQIAEALEAAHEAGVIRPDLKRGHEVPLGLPDRRYSGSRISPDGTRVATSIEDPANIEVWVSEPARGTLDRLTTDPAPDTAPLWTPNGDHVVFTSQRDGATGCAL